MSGSDRSDGSLGGAPLTALWSDPHREYGAASVALLMKAALLRRTFRPLLTLRLHAWTLRRRGPLRWLALPLRILHRLFCQLACMDLPLGLRAGPGLVLVHGWGLVINGKATIGKNVSLFNGVTLGRNDRWGDDLQRSSHYPTLEDEVWIGPHAVVVGGVTIGRGSRIAAGALVTFDVPPRSMVVGNPGRIVKHDCRPDVFNAAP